MPTLWQKNLDSEYKNILKCYNAATWWACIYIPSQWFTSQSVLIWYMHVFHKGCQDLLN